MYIEGFGYLTLLMLLSNIKILLMSVSVYFSGWHWSPNVSQWTNLRKILDSTSSFSQKQRVREDDTYVIKIRTPTNSIFLDGTWTMCRGSNKKRLCRGFSAERRQDKLGTFLVDVWCSEKLRKEIAFLWGIFLIERIRTL